MPWSSPAKRMKEMVNAIKAIWGCWHKGEDLDFRGEFYQHTLMTPIFNPGVNPFGLPKIYVAGVGPLMTQAAAESGDGFIVHEVFGEHYYRHLKRVLNFRKQKNLIFQWVLWLQQGLMMKRLTMDACKAQIGFYGSTKAYKLVLEQHGWESIQPKLNNLRKRVYGKKFHP